MVIAVYLICYQGLVGCGRGEIDTTSIGLCSKSNSNLQPVLVQKHPTMLVQDPRLEELYTKTHETLSYGCIVSGIVAHKHVQ